MSQTTTDIAVAQSPECPHCRYDLSGLSAQRGAEGAHGQGRCPECGRDFDWAKVRSARESVTAIVKRLGPTGYLAVATAVLPLMGTVVLFAYMNVAGQWLREHELWGVVLYALGFALLSGLALLPTYASAILGGWAFGFAMGFPAALCGFAGGSLLGYAIAGRVSGDRVVRLIEEKPTWRAVRDSLVGSGFGRTLLIVALVRLPPNSPFAMTNLVLASVKVKLLPFALGTLLGMAPRTGLVLWMAVQFQDSLASEAAAKTPWWYYVNATLLILLVLGVIGTIANKAVRRVTRGEARVQSAKS